MPHRGSTEKQLISFMERALWNISPDTRTRLKESHNSKIYGKETKRVSSNRKGKKSAERQAKIIHWKDNTTLECSLGIKRENQNSSAVKRKSSKTEKSLSLKKFSDGGENFVLSRKRRNVDESKRLGKYTDKKSDIVENLPRGPGISNNIPCLLSEFATNTKQKNSFVASDELESSERLRNNELEVVVLEINDISSDEESRADDILPDNERPTTRSVITQKVMIYRIISNQRRSESGPEETKNISPPSSRFCGRNMNRRAKSFSTSDESETLVSKSSFKQEENISRCSELSSSWGYSSREGERKDQRDHFSDLDSNSCFTKEAESYDKRSFKSKQSSIQEEQMKPSIEEKKPFSVLSSSSTSSSVPKVCSGNQKGDDNYSKGVKSQLTASFKNSASDGFKIPGPDSSTTSNKEIALSKTEVTKYFGSSVSHKDQIDPKQTPKLSKKKKPSSFFSTSSGSSQKTASGGTIKKLGKSSNERKNSNSNGSSVHSSTMRTTTSISDREEEFDIETLDPEITNSYWSTELRLFDEELVAVEAEKQGEIDTDSNFVPENESSEEERPQSQSVTSSKSLSSLSSLSWQIIT